MGIRENLSGLRERIEAACIATGRPVDDVRLMAVSKMQPAECLLEAYACGQRLFGENRVQEFQAKAALLGQAMAGADRAEFHLIGSLQNNKTARAGELFDGVDTISSYKTAERLDLAAAGKARRLPLLVEVKLSPEEAKQGALPADVPALIDQISSLEHVEVRGLMVVPPWSEDPETARPYFRHLRTMRDDLQKTHPRLTELSMGMSNDFVVAIEEGSTTVRIGTAIFGRRKPSAEADTLG